MKDIIDGSYQGNPTQLIKNLDIYSLGILLPSTIHKYGRLNNIPLETIVSLCHHIDLRNHFQLFRDMSSIHSEDRITAQEALKRYKKIS
jgi:hypothetical protein